MIKISVWKSVFSFITNSYLLIYKLILKCILLLEDQWSVQDLSQSDRHWTTWNPIDERLGNQFLDLKCLEILLSLCYRRSLQPDTCRSKNELVSRAARNGGKDFSSISIELPFSKVSPLFHHFEAFFPMLFHSKLHICRTPF